MKVSILGYDAGNIKSLVNSLEYIGYSPNVTNENNEILSSDKLIIPGQGSSLHLMNYLKKKKLIEPIREFSIIKKKPTLGICVGMQIFFKNLTEGKMHNGLSFFDGEVIKINKKYPLKTPNIGWHDVDIRQEILKKKIGNKNQFFHCHSYMCNFDSELELCSTNYNNNKIQTGIISDNIVGFQFHPEKSQEGGHRLLDWFLNL